MHNTQPCQLPCRLTRSGINSRLKQKKGLMFQPLFPGSIERITR